MQFYSVRTKPRPQGWVYSIIIDWGGKQKTMYYRKWPNKRTLPNKRLLSYKRPLYAVTIVLEAPL